MFNKSKDPYKIVLKFDDVDEFGKFAELWRSHSPHAPKRLDIAKAHPQDENGKETEVIYTTAETNDLLEFLDEQGVKLYDDEGIELSPLQRVKLLVSKYMTVKFIPPLLADGLLRQSGYTCVRFREERIKNDSTEELFRGAIGEAFPDKTPTHLLEDCRTCPVLLMYNAVKDFMSVEDFTKFCPFGGYVRL